MSAKFETFTRDDLKFGDVVKLRNGKFYMVFEAGFGTKILTGGPGSDWFYLSNFRDDLTWHGSPGSDTTHDLDIVAVYGLVHGTQNYSSCGDLSPENRALLWERKEDSFWQPDMDLFELITTENIKDLKPGEWIWDSNTTERKVHRRTLGNETIMEPIGFVQVDIIDEDDIKHPRYYEKIFKVTGGFWEAFYPNKFYKFKNKKEKK